ncbi:MAG: hypothetical protein ABF278_08170 [Wenyingzhuangia sp.]|uniref:hypothetical protein n=1 Tax=Wenyingzhuangia sp. TaxID=1964193 RepID=UPI00321A1BB6
MEIKFDFSDTELSQIKDLLKSNLNITDLELNQKLNDIAKTAFYEYISMISQSGIPTKVSEILQNRILFLIEHYFNRFPTESELARIFNIPTARSRSLLNILKATHRNKLSKILEMAIITFLDTGTETRDDKWEFEVKSTLIIQELNEIIESKSPGKSKFSSKSDSAGKVTLHVDSYDFLKTEFNT